MAGLTDYGWSEALEQHVNASAEGLAPARVMAEHRSGFVVQAETGERAAVLAGRLRHGTAERADLPAVGDWVLIDGDAGATAVIRKVLPRKSLFSRKVAGERTEEQVVAANIDTVCLANALDRPLSLRRIERYLAMAWESGAEPMVLLTKCDLVDNVDRFVQEAESVAFGVPVHPLSGLTGTGVDALKPYLQPGRTVALLGPSGAGKTTLINRLLGRSVLPVGPVREGDRKGRHTTTHRHLLRLPSGALVVDTPGMRELQLWDAEDGIRDTFGDIEELAPSCRFSDCRHASEPGCAVRAAVEDGTLAAARLESWHKLQREQAFMERRQDARARSEEEKRFASIMRTMKHHPKYRR